MADVLKLDKNSRDNINEFLLTIEDAELRTLLQNHIEDILAVGAQGTSDTQENRNRFYDAMKALIERRSVELA